MQLFTCLFITVHHEYSRYTIIFTKFIPNIDKLNAFKFSPTLSMSYTAATKRNYKLAKLLNFNKRHLRAQDRFQIPCSERLYRRGIDFNSTAERKLNKIAKPWNRDRHSRLPTRSTDPGRRYFTGAELRSILDLFTPRTGLNRCAYTSSGDVTAKLGRVAGE